MNRGIMLNIDNTHFMHSRWTKGIRPGRREVEQFVRQYEGTEVTDLVFDVAGRIVGFPSGVRESWIDKYLQKTENGIPVDYTDTFVQVMYDLYVVQQLDPYAIWLDEARAIGIHPWLSVRMNDCHNTADATNFAHTDFYHEHPELYRVRHREASGYFDRCFDYGEEVVRERMLAFLREVLERYDVDGLELDWQREAFCFQPGDEYRGVEILNAFMREVSHLRREAEDRWGHAIRIGTRVPADPEDALEMGFDVCQWAREGIVQTVVPTPRWATCDTDMPIGLWKRLLSGCDVTLAPGIEILMRPGNHKPFYATSEHVAALAAQHFALGGDKTYLFNYFDDPTPEDSYWNNSSGHAAAAVLRAHQEQLLAAIGDPAQVERMARRHTICYRDLRPIWRKREQMLPLTCDQNGEVQYVRLCVGHIPAGAQVEITLGLSTGRTEDVILYAQRKRLTQTGTATLTPDFLAHPVSTFRMENDGALPPYLVLELTAAAAPFTVDYIDCAVHAVP